MQVARYEVGMAYEVAINGLPVLLGFLSCFSLFLSLSLPYDSTASQSFWALLLSPSSQATAPQSFLALSLSLSILFSLILVNRLAVLHDSLCLSLSLSLSLSVPHTSQQPRGLSWPSSQVVWQLPWACPAEIAPTAYALRHTHIHTHVHMHTNTRSICTDGFIPLCISVW